MINNLVKANNDTEKESNQLIQGLEEKLVYPLEDHIVWLDSVHSLFKRAKLVIAQKLDQQSKL